MTKDEFLSQANEIIESYKIADRFFDLIQKAYNSSNFSSDSRIINTTHSHLAMLGLSQLVARLGIKFENATEEVDYFMFECNCGAKPSSISYEDKEDSSKSYEFKLDSIETFYDYLVTAYHIQTEQR